MLGQAEQHRGAAVVVVEDNAGQVQPRRQQLLLCARKIWISQLPGLGFGIYSILLNRSDEIVAEKPSILSLLSSFYYSFSPLSSFYLLFISIKVFDLGFTI
jgi:hypothetical protein